MSAPRSRTSGSVPSTDSCPDDAERKLEEMRGVVIAYVRREVSCGRAMVEIERILNDWPRREVSR